MPLLEFAWLVIAPVLWVLGLIAIVLATIVLAAILFVNVTILFLISGRPNTGSPGMCKVCGGQRIGPPRHRWQLLHYWSWLFQHSHSLSEYSAARDRAS